MGDHVDLAEAGRRAVPVIERTDRDLAPDCRIEPGTSPPATARRDLCINEQAIDGCRADGQNTIAVRLAKPQSAMLLERQQQGRDHHLEPLAAHPIRRLPQRRHRVLDRRAVSTSAISRCLDPVRPNRLVLPECAHRMLAMPTRRRTQLVEDAPLLRPFGRPVTLRHRRHHLAPRAHADLSRHRGHRTDSVTLPQSLARSFPVTFWMRQCALQMRVPSNIRMLIGPDRTPMHSCSSTLRFVLFVRHSYPAAIPALQISFLLEMSTILLPQTDHGSGRRHERQGRKDPDRGIRVAR